MAVAKVTAKFLSTILHPVFIPLYAVIYFFREASDLSQQVVIAALFLVLIPGLLSLIYFRLSGIRNLFSIDLKFRRLPFLFNVLGIGGYIYILIKLNHSELMPYLIIYLILNLMCFGISLHWKISLHLCGLGSVLGLAWVFWPINNWAPYIAILMVSASSLAWARYYLKAHDKLQLVAGLVLGWLVFGGFTWISVHYGFIHL